MRIELQAGWEDENTKLRERSIETLAIWIFMEGLWAAKKLRNRVINDEEKAKSICNLFSLAAEHMNVLPVHWCFNSGPDNIA